MELDGTAVLVTGGARRVGRAIVLELARAGCDVAVHYHRSEPEAVAVAEQVRALGRRAVTICGDLLDSGAWPRLIEETVAGLGGLRILVNNAAEFLTDGLDTLDALDVDRWDRVFRLNVLAPTALCRCARPHLEAGADGRIVNLCDISARRPWPDHLAYCASKAALECVTRALAIELAPAVKVNGVAPGIAVFPDAYPKALRDRLVGRVPLGRAGSPGEIARLVRFLVESGDYMTGQVIALDGGRSLV